MRKIHFGWIAPLIGVAQSRYVPLVMAQEAEVLPVVAKHFDSVWVADHFYPLAEFAERFDPFLDRSSSPWGIATRHCLPKWERPCKYSVVDG